MMAGVGRSFDFTGRAALAAMGLCLVACSNDDDLPPGWEDAEPVAELTQSSCSEGAPGKHDEHATFAPGEKRVDVEYLDAHFRCEQRVEGFYKDSGGRLDVLVQPVEMHPSSVTRCDCLYDIGVAIEDIRAGSRTVTLFRRWDDLNDPNDPVTIDSESIVVE